MMDKREASERTIRIQNGSGIDRDNLPPDMRGSIAEGRWNDSLFAYGMEYGYLLAMHDVIHNKDSTK